MAKKQTHKEIADQFSDAEMEGVRRYGEALGGVTPFDEEVERHLAGHEKNYAKMRAAQSGGKPGENESPLAPSEMESAQVTQRGAIGQQAGAAGAAKAAQAQGAQVPVSPPPAAPGGPAGVSKPYAAEAKQTPPGIPEEEPPAAPGGGQ